MQDQLEQLVAGASSGTRPVEVGDIFEASWGYDQTNIDYYLVVSITASRKSVRVVKIGQTFTEQAGVYGDRVIPDPSRVLSEPVTKRLQQSSYDGVWSIKVRTWGVWAHPWDGQSNHQTDPVFGH